MKKTQLAFAAINTLLIALSILFITACAIVQPIGGGPKDTLAPELEYSIPLPNSRNVTLKKFTFKFDEYIQISNFTKEVRVNPYYDPKDITTQVVGRKLILQFTDTLKDNTTYNINFGNAISDINEKTAKQNFNFTFSTGEQIDTLNYNGVIIDNETHLPVSNALVTLYPVDNSDPTKQLPNYSINSNKDGSFQFNNLANKNYKLYSFTDKNNDNLYSPKTEEIGFITEQIQLNNSTVDTCYLSKPITETFSMKAPTFGENCMEIKFNRGVKVINKISSVDRYNLIDEYKTLRLYPNQKEINLELSIVDSLGQTIDTSLTTSYRPKPIKDSLLTLAIKIHQTPTNINQNLQLSSSYLIEAIDTSKIFSIKNNDTINISRSSISIMRDEKANTITFIPDNQIDTTNIHIEEGAIKFVTGHINSSLSKTYIPIRKKKFGQISGNITTTEEAYIVYLLDDKNKVIIKETNPKQFNYPFVKPGSYKIKVLIDKNKDGIYTSGTLNRQPESYYYYNKPINVKSNWEIGNINITF